MSIRIRSLSAVFTAVALLCVVPVAGAATLDRAPDGVLVYNGGPQGTLLNIQAGYDGNSAVFYGSSLDPVSSYPADCTAQYDDSVITCARPPAVRVDLGDGDDKGQVSADVTYAVTIFGGAGRDLLEGNGSGQQRSTAARATTRSPAQPATTRSAAATATTSSRVARAATASAAARAMTLLRPDGYEDPSADIVDGGPGRDTVDQDYSSRFANTVSPVAITLAGGADDGRPGEADDLHGVERIVLHTPGRVVGTDGPDEIVFKQVGTNSELIGGAGDDSLQAGDGADTLDGGAGNDAIDGGFGDDTITGGPGRDIISADLAGGDCGPIWCKLPYGNDTVNARDGEVDSISCGAGTDHVIADAIDVVAPDCEQVDRAGATSASSDSGTAGTTVRLAAGKRPGLRSALAKGLVLRVTGVGAGRITLVARDKSRVVATGSARSTGGVATVRLRFSAAARKRLAKRSTLRIAVTGGGLHATVTVRR